MHLVVVVVVAMMAWTSAIRIPSSPVSKTRLIMGGSATANVGIPMMNINWRIASKSSYLPIISTALRNIERRFEEEEAEPCTVHDCLFGRTGLLFSFISLSIRRSLTFVLHIHQDHPDARIQIERATCASKIVDCEKKIAECEAQIKEVEKELMKRDISANDLTYWRNKETQLRNKEENLREENLREEKNLYLRMDKFRGKEIHSKNY